MKIVDDVDAAIAHIEHYSSHHTEAIIAEDPAVVEAFFNRIDSAILLHNASTQFADGGEFGFGGEIGIATGKMHARGPVGRRAADQLQISGARHRADPSLSRAIPIRVPASTDLPPSAPGMRIGLFGGSFNPPHDGHRLVSRESLKRLGLDAVWWLVTPGNPLKDHQPLAPLAERVAAARGAGRSSARPRHRV